MGDDKDARSGMQELQMKTNKEKHEVQVKMNK